jgi:hypothetical protein
MGTTMNITKMNSTAAARKPRQLLGAHPGSMPSGLFVAALLARRWSHVARDEFPGTASPALLAQLGEPVLVRSDRAADEVEALVLLPSDCLALIDTGYGNVDVEVAGATREAVDTGVAALRNTLGTPQPEPSRVSVAFWMRGDRGGDVRHRQIDAPSFDDVASNYPAGVRDALERLLTNQAPDRGRLILWRGEPGTGKSHALRALVRAWAPWCSAHFILDPEELFGRGGIYLLDILTWDGDDEDKWRLVILEDAGELIASDGRTVAGQGLSRLLNVADGLLGHGTRTLVLITTNEPVRRLHPATRRPGRCLADIEFGPLSVAEANAWLAAHGHDHRVDRPVTLAELYAHPSHGPNTVDESAPVGFGFARALADADELAGLPRRGFDTVNHDDEVAPAGGELCYAPSYDELRLRISPDSQHSYRVLASTSSAEVHGSFALRFDSPDHDRFKRLASRSQCRGAFDGSALDEAKRFGGALFGALFCGQTYGLYRDALAEARSRGRGLRIKLCLTGAPDLIDLPWEFLFDAPHFLAMSTSTPVVRYLDLPRCSRPLAVTPPLRILGVVSSPEDYERLDGERERANLESALSALIASGAVELQWLEAATVDGLLHTLRRGTFHALHYIGHGTYDTKSQRGLLLFEDEWGWGRAVSGERLGTILHESKSLRLAVLNACEGAKSGRSDPFAGVAESLVQREIPAVIAMQFDISDNGAIVFANGLYTAIATGSPVDAAVAAARLSMFAKLGDDLEWGTPALYMRVTDGRVFELPDQAAGARECVGR